MCSIQAQYRIKGGTLGPLFGEYYAFCWSNLIYFAVQTCGDRAGECETEGGEGPDVLCVTVTHGNFKTRPFSNGPISP